MKLEINIEKMHFWILLAVIVLLGGAALVFATGYSNTLASHATLFVDTIRGKAGGGTVTVNDNLVVTGGTITGNGAGISGVSYAASAGSAGSVPWGGITAMPAGFSDGVDNTGSVTLVCNQYSTYTASVSIAYSYCPAGYQVSGGGCDLAVVGDLIKSVPSGNGWKCQTSPANSIWVYVMCCQLR